MDPLAYLLTWTTYGSWLPGDERGWVEAGRDGLQAPDAVRKTKASQMMTDDEVRLDESQRKLVETTIREVCAYRNWLLHAVNARSNHVHLVVTASREPEVVLSQLKAWTSRRLSENGKAHGKQWWTEHGSTKWINDEDYFQAAVAYVNERQ